MFTAAETGAAGADNAAVAATHSGTINAGKALRSGCMAHIPFRVGRMTPAFRYVRQTPMLTWRLLDSPESP
ncbi:hypothetical protein GCM10027569_66370 [Flindersiella endophytica]